MVGGGRRREGKRQETKDQGTDGVAAAAAGDNQLNCFIGRATAQRTRICGDATTAKEKIIRKKCGGGNGAPHGGDVEGVCEPRQRTVYSIQKTKKWWWVEGGMEEGYKMGAFIQSSQALARGVIPRVFAKKYWGTAHCISVSAQGSAAGEKQMATHTTQPAADSSHLCSSTRSSSRAREQQLTAAEHHHHARCTAAFFCCFFCQNYATADSSAP